MKTEEQDIEIEDVNDECYYLRELHKAETKIKRLQEQLEKKDKLIEKLKKDKKDCKRCAFNCFHQMQSGV